MGGGGTMKGLFPLLQYQFEVRYKACFYAYSKTDSSNVWEPLVWMGNEDPCCLTSSPVSFAHCTDLSCLSDCCFCEISEDGNLLRASRHVLKSSR